MHLAALRFAGPLAGLSLAVAASGQDGAFWAYQPLQRPVVPNVAATAWPLSPVDAFVLSRLQAHGLQPSPPADPAALLRRVTYDLTGLPPTPDEIAAFAADPSSAAYEQVVDRLLASPQHGVKWARHWLDLVRYAETDGYERDRRKPFVWRYRDWVVDALNADMPYAEFLRAQLAGDEKAAPTVADLVATGFHRLGVWDDEPTDRLQARYDDLDGVADTTARVMFGVSMGCARCHDHKKDPLTQRDYYAFLAFFENVRPYDLQAETVPADGALASHREAVARHATRRAALQEELRVAAAAAWDAATVEARDAALAADRSSALVRYDCDRLLADQLRPDSGTAVGSVHGQVVAVDGRRGTAMRFDGDDHVELPRLVQDSFTVAFFVRSDHRGPGRGEDTRWFTGAGLVDGEVPGIVADWGIAWHSEGRIVAGTGDPETFVASGPGHHDGQWHHVAFCRDRPSGRIALYVDGGLVGDALGSKNLLDAPSKLTLGRLQPGGGGFRGDLDELRFYDRALSAAEVAALALDLPGGTASPVLAASATVQALGELAALRTPELATVEVLAVQEHGRRGPEGFVRVRGNAHVRGEPVRPAFPAMLGGGEPAIVPVDGARASSGRRTALADWIVDPRHPLTWRVAANRLWQHHFGRGLVRSSNDFGRLGDLPTHPELLDWLACELLARGGSLKAMHRLLVTSATYKMASMPVPAAAAKDPQNDLFWRFDRRRLGAEELRDSLLAMAGVLETGLGGPSVFPPLPAQVLATASRPDEAWGQATAAEAARRSLYVHSKRSLQEPLLAAFDQADTDNSCPARFATVQATQALILWNGDFAHQQAERFAARLQAEAPDLPAQLERGLLLTTQRPPRAADRDRLLALAADLQRNHGKTQAQALQRCCLVLLNGNEFAYLD
jgi:hypothetical protein